MKWGLESLTLTWHNEVMKPSGEQRTTFPVNMCESITENKQRMTAKNIKGWLRATRRREI